MPTLNDWLALDLDEQDRAFLRTLHERRPEWLATGDLTERILVRFDSPLGGAWPIVLELDELSLHWGDWHDHLYLLEYSWPQVDPATVAIGKIEAVLSGWYVRVRATGEAAERKWAGSALLAGEDVPRYIEELTAQGHGSEIIRWPGVSLA